MNTIPITDTLQQAHDSLTPVNWKKGSYFKQENNTLCMCAHGAVQALVNPEVKNRLNIYLASALASARSALEAAVACRAAGAAGVADTWAEEIQNKSISQLDVWTNRPDWVRQDYINDGINYGSRDAHYLLGMVGLTIGFNDAPNTTLEMVKAKFQEAITLAKQLGV